MEALCSIGPSGFARYARLFHPVEPGDDPFDPGILLDFEGDLGVEALRRLTGIAGSAALIEALPADTSLDVEETLSSSDLPYRRDRA
ncbi:hypothetical protein [Nocardia sp. CY41]|uniref:hypothetical protein n=1 Tax=Nocardia sp. CY41 TaxID=2608686 RepID=UPI001358A10B|nr:hypothetical protein [Nocardia sp. CY41]